MSIAGFGSLAAVMDFDPWRDLTPEQWREAGVTRPRRRPKEDRTFPDLPPPPLGVWTVDWANPGQEDEVLPRATAPWLLPALIQRDGADDALALAALAKRREYLPADWPEESDDRTAASGVLTVTFEAPPANDPGGLLVLSARLNREAQIKVNGDDCEMNILGVSARRPPDHEVPRRGWHTWQVVSFDHYRPAGVCAIEIDFASARCAQLLLSLTTPPPPHLTP